MLWYCLKCRKNTESKNPKSCKGKKGRVILLPKCLVCGNKKSKFVKQKEASGLLSSLGIKTPLNKIPLLGPLLFKSYKMNKIVNKLLLAGDKLTPEML